MYVNSVLTFASVARRQRMKEAFWRALGMRLAAARRRRGVQQAALATQIGISRNYLVRIELGDRPATLETLANLAAALDVELWTLLVEERSQSAQVERIARAIEGLPSPVIDALIGLAESLRSTAERPLPTGARKRRGRRGAGPPEVSRPKSTADP